jgi:hypothetical protein
MRLMAWTSVVALGATWAAILGWGHFTRPNKRELTLLDGTTVFGLLTPKDPSSGTPILVSLRFEDAPPGSAMRSPMQLHLRGRDFTLRDLSPADLCALGIDVSPSDVGSSDDLEAFVGYGSKNEFGGIEFGFAKGKLRTFFARCRVPGRCDFELSWPGRDRFRLPISERRLRSVVEEPVSVRDYFGF